MDEDTLREVRDVFGVDDFDINEFFDEDGEDGLYAFVNCFVNIFLRIRL